MNEYTVCYPEELRLLCIRENWFTCGTSRQYEKMFDMNREHCSIDEIALVIWICSNDNFSREYIANRLRETVARAADRPTKKRGTL